MAEETYTLDEAKRVLAERECQESGHSWSVLESRTMADPAGVPTGVVCGRCKDAWEIAPKEAVA